MKSITVSNFKKKNVLNLIVFLFVVSAIIIYARESGIVGRTLKNGVGCTCHSETPTANVLVAIEGPDTLAVGQSATYTLTIQGGPLVAGGTNIAASDGDLLPIGGDLRKENFELTHVQPKLSSGGMVTFQFTYTAPAIAGQQTLFANGNSVNLNGFNSGDQWNFAPNKIINIVKPTGVDDELIISSYELNQNYPNPFNPSTVISWQSPAYLTARQVSSWQTLKVYDLLGNEVAVLVDEWKEAGNHSVNFDATGLPSGVYFYKLTAGTFSETKKMLLLR